MVALMTETRAVPAQDVARVLPLSIQAEAESVPRPLEAIAVMVDRAETHAAAALAPAQALAARLDADLILLHVRQGETEGEADAALELLARSVATARAKGLRARDLVVTAPAAAAPEAVAQALFAALSGMPVGLVVLPSRAACQPGSKPAGDELVRAVIRTSHLPLLLVPPGYGSREGDGARQWIGWEATALAATRAGARPSPLRLVMGLDGSPTAELALPLVAALAQTMSAEISLVRVAASGTVLACSHSGVVTGINAAGVYLQRCALHLQAAGVEPGAIRTAARIGSPSDELLAQATREQASILVLASHPRADSPGQLGGVTTQAVSRAALPILLVPQHTSPQT